MRSIRLSSPVSVPKRAARMASSMPEASSQMMSISSACWPRAEEGLLAFQLQTKTEPASGAPAHLTDWEETSNQLRMALWAMSRRR